MAVARTVLQSVTVYKPDKTYNGFTLFAPMAPRPSNVWLMDMQGRFVHRWQLPGWIRLRAQLLPNGNLLFGLFREAEAEASLHRLPYYAGEVDEMDWDGNIVWQYKERFMDAHDQVRMKNGNTLIQKYVKVPEDIAAKVKGGVPGSEGAMLSEGKKEMLGYALQEITPEGKVAWEWLTYEHLDPEIDAFSPLASRVLWPGWNSLVELPDGNFMTCSFNTDTILIIDKATGNIKWRWGKGEIRMPHNPSMLDNGNVLVLDNGRGRDPGYSRIIEINPKTNKIEWEFKEGNPVHFYTSYIGGCERLPNGNTLICEGAKGRFFEVTAKGEVVWEYIVPFYGGEDWMFYGRNTNATFRCHRYNPDYPGLAGKKLDPEKLDMWNRLYGPDAFGPWAGRAVAGGLETAPIKEEEVSKVKYQESKPSVADKEAMSSRIKALGYAGDVT